MKREVMGLLLVSQGNNNKKYSTKHTGKNITKVLLRCIRKTVRDGAFK